MADSVRFEAEATWVVDQFVVDGKLDLVVVNGETQHPAVHVSSLGAVALNTIWGKASYRVRQDFGRALDADPRHLYHDYEQYYQFDPVLTPGSRVEPRLKAYICGTAHATAEQYAAAAVRVQQLFDVLCLNSDGVLTPYNIGKILQDCGITSRSEIAAMREHFSRGAGGQVELLPDGRFVIKSVFKGNVDTIEPEPQIDNLVGAVLRALQNVETSKNMVTNGMAILGVMTREQGHLLAENQLSEFMRILDQLPGILRPIGHGRYVLNKGLISHALAIVSSPVDQAATRHLPQQRSEQSTAPTGDSQR